MWPSVTSTSRCRPRQPRSSGRCERTACPVALPDDEDFDGQSDSFGAAYEAAWLRLSAALCSEEGESTLLRLYRRADGAEDFRRVFRATTGSRLGRFTTEWQVSLRHLAG